jgi:nucleoside-diphosphate-sugar epimerase
VRKESRVTYATSVEGTEARLRLRKRDQKVLFASTGSICGSVPDSVCNESTPRPPITLYGETKAAAEQMILDAGNGIALRFATAYGVSNRTRSLTRTSVKRASKPPSTSTAESPSLAAPRS